MQQVTYAEPVFRIFISHHESHVKSWNNSYMRQIKMQLSSEILKVSNQIYPVHSWISCCQIWVCHLHWNWSSPCFGCKSFQQEVLPTEAAATSCLLILFPRRACSWLVQHLKQVRQVLIYHSDRHYKYPALQCAYEAALSLVQHTCVSGSKMFSVVYLVTRNTHLYL